jgi:hypothetical protein
MSVQQHQNLPGNKKADKPELSRLKVRQTKALAI